MSRRTTFSPSGMVSTTDHSTDDGTIETDTADASINDLIDQMSHRQQ